MDFIKCRTSLVDEGKATKKVFTLVFLRNKTPFLPLKKKTFFVLALILEFMSDTFI
jgi:hypothetical protein